MEERRMGKDVDSPCFPKSAKRKRGESGGGGVGKINRHF